jgi:glutathione S-transferase
LRALSAPYWGSDMFTLYYAPHTCSLASHIVLKDVGAKYELKRIDFGKAEQQSPSYSKVNPKGRVPTLVTRHGILTETPALLVYIVQSFPEARLAPLEDPFAFAQLQAFNVLNPPCRPRASNAGASMGR